eukprot:CAMPEP_0172679368 /NCGR_PEP_ID=MMETSP1074-20121228/16019_1 /TAXON_ID=2916 /ORGANISM="Ceratium fusus, Strain PA161109" /LENGTH=95 /DNA_ID=CAMNT_0013497535 /DNA_START=152 /DNA_END=440 /DNA_ORIENTATION=+
MAMGKFKMREPKKLAASAQFTIRWMRALPPPSRTKFDNLSTMEESSAAYAMQRKTAMQDYVRLDAPFLKFLARLRRVAPNGAQGGPAKALETVHG